MGQSRSGREVAMKMARLANEFDDLPRQQVEDASLLIKKAVLRLAPRRLSGVGKKGAKLGVRYNLSTYEGGQSKARVFATGPFHLIERDTKPHTIPRQTTKSGRARKNLRPVVIPGVGVRASAHHPGTKGQHPWRRGVDDAMPQARRILTSSTAHAVSKII